MNGHYLYDVTLKKDYPWSDDLEKLPDPRIITYKKAIYHFFPNPIT